MAQNYRAKTLAVLGSVLFGLALGAPSAHAATGVCDANPPLSTDACTAAIQQNGSVINDIFTDLNGLTGQQLPVFGQPFNHWPGCDGTVFAGCSGQSVAPFDCPGQYTCNGLPNSFANATTYLGGLDRLWWHPCRLSNHNLVNGCPDFLACIADGTPGSYFPWEGIVFDLGGPSNKVAIFAQNDHGPQPCESAEYTVFLSDNPYAKDSLLDPKTDGVDPMKWNRAVLATMFTKGWVEVRPPDPAGHAVCGDTAEYSVEEDSFVTVYSLPCGITFRYASIVAGNDGLDFPECAFDSSEAELDAVAGLTETGAGVCPDNDGDLFVDCNCPGAPPACDCNDADASIHPSAPEACDSPDLSCDGIPGSCPADLTCYQSLCLPACLGENAFCPAGSSCEQTPVGAICVPLDCTQAGCPPGSVCKDGDCVPACDDVVCPGEQLCIDGLCLDPCATLQCPEGQLCQGGLCFSPCSCLAGDIGCLNLPGTVCDEGFTELCVHPACKGLVCPAGQVCDPNTAACVDFCNANVNCPEGQKCLAPTGCVSLCTGVTCQQGYDCDPKTGQCVDSSCVNVSCIPPSVCVAGQCVDMGTGGAGGAGGGETTGIGGAGGGSTSSEGSGGGRPDQSGDEGGCGCLVVGGSSDDEGSIKLALLLSALGLAWSVRRRK